MKIKSMIAAVAASAIAVAAMAVPASAAITNPNDKEQITYALNETDEKWATIQGVKVTITAADGWTSSGFGGGIVFQGLNHDWNSGSKEFNVSGEGTPDPEKDKLNSTKTGDNTFVMTYDNGSAIFADIKGEEKAWAQLCIQSWWGADITIDNIEYIYDANAAADDQPAETTTAAADDTAATTTAEAKADDKKTTTTAADTKKKDTSTTTATKTGDAGVGVVVAGLTLAGAAALIARKKH